jgi:hypothetical protein
MPWLRVLDQQAKQAPSYRPVVDPPYLIVAQAHRDELGQLPVGPDDTQRPVGRVHQLDRGLRDPPQRRLQVQARADRDDSLKQPPHPVPGGEHRLQPCLQLSEQLIQAKLRKQLRAGGTGAYRGVPAGRAP